MLEENKTSLTKTSVKGSDETEPSRQHPSNDDLNGSDKDERGVPWKNVAKEERERNQAISEKLDKAMSRLEELEAIEEKRKLTSSEQREKDKVENRVDDLEKELYIFDTDPQFRAAREKIKREVSKSKKEATEEALKSFYADQVEDFLDDEAEKREMKPKELRDELNKFLKADHMKLNPLRRTKVALKEYDNFHKFKKEKDDFEKKKQEFDQFSESDGRIPRESTLDGAIKNKDYKSQMKYLGL